eukprot:7844-Rhodomonas_salina.3
MVAFRTAASVPTLNNRTRSLAHSHAHLEQNPALTHLQRNHPCYRARETNGAVRCVETERNMPCIKSRAHTPDQARGLNARGKGCTARRPCDCTRTHTSEHTHAHVSSATAAESTARINGGTVRKNGGSAGTTRHVVGNDPAINGSNGLRTAGIASIQRSAATINRSMLDINGGTASVKGGRPEPCERNREPDELDHAWARGADSECMHRHHGIAGIAVGFVLKEGSRRLGLEVWDWNTQEHPTGADFGMRWSARIGEKNKRRRAGAGLTEGAQHEEEG